MDIKTAVHRATNKLKMNNIKSADLDCEILLSKVLNKDKKFIILNPNKSLDLMSFNYYENLIKQRCLGKPIAYLLGKKDFWKNEFYVNKNTLIPRPDTEIIIEQVLKLTKNKPSLKILDIGVGSGCILLSILKEKKNFYGVGIDISKKCIDMSIINAKKLSIFNRVKFFKSDVDNFCNGKYDLIVSNPPYINDFHLKYLEKDVKDFEPILALKGGLDGTSEIRKVINRSSELIKKNGKLILEIAFDQKNRVINILKKKGFFINIVVKDIAKNDRCIISTKI